MRWTFRPPGEVHEEVSSSGAYDRFRSGYTFAGVRQELDVEARQVFEFEGRRMFITRRTILGRLHQHKQTAWRARTKRWDFDPIQVPAIPGVSFDAGVDFF